MPRRPPELPHDDVHADGRPESGVALTSILRTDDLMRRPPRAPDHQAENRALVSLAATLADAPETILQKLAEVALEICRADSAGISLLSKDGSAFYWPAVAGALKPYLGEGTPRHFGPCGVVLDRDASQLFTHPERVYPYLIDLDPPVEEGLLSPFYVKGVAVGTVWVIAHGTDRQFDAEDLRLVGSLGRFASGAYQVLQAMDALQERTAALAEADRRKTEFLALLAHELRNPLAPIRNAVQILGRSAGDPAAVQSMTRVLDRQVGQVVRLVDDLLDISRINQGKIELHQERVELASVVSHTVEAVRPLSERLGHVLTVRLPPEPIHLHADPTRLTQIIGNLLNNACKFSPRGARIELDVARDGSEVVIAIRDDGIGIAEEELSRIFEMFTQVDASLERSRDGLGIGLTLVRNLVELHGGTIEAHSAGPGQGSRFVVRLPTVPDAPAPPAERARAKRPAESPRRILIVDDNRDAVESLALLLEMRGHDVHVAYDGPHAVEVAVDLRPEVILLDIGLPTLNGYEVARRIRTQPQGHDAMLVAVTGWGQDEDRRRAEEAGFDAHLVKPLDIGALSKLLAESAAR